MFFFSSGSSRAELLLVLSVEFLFLMEKSMFVRSFFVESRSYFNFFLGFYEIPSSLGGFKKTSEERLQTGFFLKSKASVWMYF
jgi:hypothetical protein